MHYGKQPEASSNPPKFKTFRIFESAKITTISKARLTATEIVQSGKSDSEASSQSMISEARNAAEGEAAEVAKKGDSAIGSIHDGGEGSRGEAVKAVLDAFRS